MKGTVCPASLGAHKMYAIFVSLVRISGGNKFLVQRVPLELFFTDCFAYKVVFCNVGCSNRSFFFQSVRFMEPFYLEF